MNADGRIALARFALDVAEMLNDYTGPRADRCRQRLHDLAAYTCSTRMDPNLPVLLAALEHEDEHDPYGLTEPAAVWIGLWACSEDETEADAVAALANVQALAILNEHLDSWRETL